jgi:hypothetical protein
MLIYVLLKSFIFLILLQIVVMILLNRDLVLDLGKYIKLILCEDAAIDIADTREFEGDHFLPYSDLSKLCSLIKKKTSCSRIGQNFNIYSIKNSKESSAEAKSHYDAAKNHGLEFLGHSMTAGATIECPPIAILETYNAVQALNKMADEYLKAKEIEDREQADRNFKDMTGQD